MDRIEKGNCTEIGFIQKPHGLKGEVIMLLNAHYEDIDERLDHCFIEIDGGLVPFFASEDGIKYRNDESVIIKFDYTDSQEKAKEISGCKVFISNDDLSENESSEDYNNLIGMQVIDENAGELGTIAALDDFSGNIVITVTHPKSEILIPLSDEIIRGIDEKNNRIYLDCPEGLIDIYLD
jgi:16S rRNA processing protein RimM